MKFVANTFDNRFLSILSIRCCSPNGHPGITKDLPTSFRLKNNNFSLHIREKKENSGEKCTVIDVLSAIWESSNEDDGVASELDGVDSHDEEEFEY